MTTVGFISPPNWDDPTPAEYHSISGHRTIAHQLAIGAFNWTLDEIGRCEPDLAAAAVDLVERGADAVATVGIPFGWAGLAADETPHDRNRRITEHCGVPVVSAVSGIVDRLRAHDASTVALAVTYYDHEWKREWAKLLERLGFTVTTVRSLEDLALTSAPLAAADPTYWSPTTDQILANVAAVSSDSSDAVVISGAGARTLGLADRWNSVTAIPVVAADTSLYRALAELER